MVSHRVELEAPRLFRGVGTGPVLLERTDRRFMQNAIAELGEPRRHDEARASEVRERKGGGLHLYQPVHRVNHLAAIAAVCADMPGRPRVDPAKIDSAGLVVRKVRDGRGRSLGELAWVVARDGTSRWEPPDRWDPRERLGVLPALAAGASLSFADPDPKRRAKRSTGRAELDERIAVLKQRGSSRAEAVTPIFPLPPQACAAAGETVLLGLVPTASRDTEQAPERELPDREELDAGGFFPVYVTTSGSGTSVPFARQVIDVAGLVGGAAPKRADPAFSAYGDFVREMITSFDITGSGSAQTRLRGALEQIMLPFVASEGGETTWRSAYQHLVEAARVLLEGDREQSFRMPERWGEVTPALEATMKDAMVGVTMVRFTDVALDRARFAERDASYIVRTYVRIRRDDGCPPELFWSAPSAEFRIAPWFDDSPGPRPVIDLPDPLRDGLGAIKPNVTFAVPPVLSNLLAGNKPEDLLDGKGNEPSSGGLMWLCSFSIPIITICAFLMLNIIIKLLNIVFWWMPFVKICIPIPKLK